MPSRAASCSSEGYASRCGAISGATLSGRTGLAWRDGGEVVPMGLVGIGRVGAECDEDTLRAAVLSLLLLTSGCATIGHAVSDRRTVAGCQVADGVTSYVALKKGAVELNGIFAGLSGSQILAIKLMLAYIVYKVLPEKPTDGERFAMTIAAGMGCVPALNNVSVIRGMP